MSIRIEGKEIVIDGFEQGISQSPFSGIADMRNVNTISIPGAVATGFKPTTLTKPPTVSALAFTVVASTDVFTVSSTTGWYNGMAIYFNSIVTSTGFTANRAYWVENLTATTFTINSNAGRVAAGQINVATGDGSGTLSTYTMGKIIDHIADASMTHDNDANYVILLDNAGRTWWVDSTGGTETTNLVHLGNTTLTSSGTGRGIEIYKGYLIVFRESSADQLFLAALEGVGGYTDTSALWGYAWESVSSSTTEPRPILVGQDDIMYYDNGNRVGSIAENAGSTFDPASGATYTENVTALDIPSGDEVISLAELGQKLLIGGVDDLIYPWDRISSSFNLPITVPEKYISHMESDGFTVYIFAGQRGRIYQTNGSTTSFFSKIPDYLTSKVEPYFTTNATYLGRNQIYFSFTAEENDNTAITGMSGVWAIELTTGVFRNITESAAGSNATINVIAENVHGNRKSSGDGLYMGVDSSGTYTVDKTSSSPFAAGETKIDSDIIPIGTNKFPYQISQLEYKLAKPLVANESVQILYRSDLKESYTSVFTGNTTGKLSEASDATFEAKEWIQIRAVLTSTATTPSFVPLREIRLQGA